MIASPHRVGSPPGRRRQVYAGRVGGHGVLAPGAGAELAVWPRPRAVLNSPALLREQLNAQAAAKVTLAIKCIGLGHRANLTTVGGGVVEYVRLTDGIRRGGRDTTSPRPPRT